jgi:outer membrane receptor protein involved in Fe transport
MKNINAFFLFFFFFCNVLIAQEDTTAVQSINLSKYVFTFSDIKEMEVLRERPVSGTFVSMEEIEKQHVFSLKELSSFIPNFYIPDYGSKITSSIYMRGIGSRIDQPAVGLYIDGIPMLNKSFFDFDFYEIKSLEVLRGPQSTLYGRNTMSGIINIQTVAPDLWTRQTNLSASYGNYNDIRLRATHFNHVGEVAFSAGGYYNYNEGFFTNEYTGNKIDDITNAGGRAILRWGKQPFSLSYTVSYDYMDQGGYPYARYNEETGNTFPISYNDYSGYRRSMLNNGLLMKWTTPSLEISSATGYQYLDDRMDMDQDFTVEPVFTLVQKQQEHAFTEEIIIKPVHSDRNYQWLSGFFGFYKDLHAQAPVTFKEKGISALIEDNVNNIPILQRMNMKLDVVDDLFLIESDFKYPIHGVALFHQSVYNDLFVKGLSVTGGIRLDYEKATLDYNSYSGINYIFTPMLTTSRNVETSLSGSESKEFFQVLPKIAFKYDINKSGNVYISVSKGYKAGGFNTQAFADILQEKMQGDIKTDIYNQIPDQVPIKNQLAEILLSDHNTDIKDVISYDPEYSWNYEIGTHLTLLKNKLFIDAAVFFIDCRDQQITVFSTHGIGRMMRNAGRTESLGMESSVRVQPVKELNLNVSYGYTHATFKKYSDGINDYKGNYVPFAPQHTFSAGGDYTWSLKDKFIDKIILQAQYTGVGRIYWTEENDIYQNFYGLLNGSIGVEKNMLKVELWAKNILDASYNTFYFENMNNSFLQKGKPFQIGGRLRIAF